MNLYESRAITRARQTLSLLINQALLDQDLSLSDLSVLTGIDVSRLERIVSGTQMSRGEIKLIEVVHLFDILNKEFDFSIIEKLVPTPIATIQNKLDETQLALFNDAPEAVAEEAW